MKRIVSATEARRHLGELMTYVVESNEVVIVERRGVPSVAILSVEKFNDFERRLQFQASNAPEKAEGQGD